MALSFFQVLTTAVSSQEYFFPQNISHPEHTPSVLKVIPKGCRFEYKQRLQI